MSDENDAEKRLLRERAHAAGKTEFDFLFEAYKLNSLTVSEKLFQAQADASQNVNAPNRWKRLGTNLTNISVLASSVIVGVFAVALFVLSPARGVSNPIIIVMAVISLLSFLSALFEDATGLGKGFLPGTRRYISFANVVLGLIAYLWFPV